MMLSFFNGIHNDYKDNDYFGFYKKLFKICDINATFDQHLVGYFE